MITDLLQSSSAYESLHPRFPAAFALLKDLIARGVPDGRYDLPGTENEVYVLIGTSNLEKKESVIAESHQKYIDVQAVLEGVELMYLPVAPLPATTPYDAEKDFALHAPVPETACHRLRMIPGSFTVFFANELHAPGHPAPAFPTRVRKAIIKILA